MVNAPLTLFHDVRLAHTEIPGPSSSFLSVNTYMWMTMHEFHITLYTSPSAAAVFVDEFQLHGTYLE